MNMAEPQQKSAKAEDKDDVILRLSALIAAVDTENAELKTVIAAKDTEIAAKDTEITAKDTEITAKDTEIANLIAAKDTEIAVIDTEIAAMDTEIAAKDTENAVLKTVIADLEEKERSQSLGSLFEKFPFIYNHTKSSVHTRTGHKEAKVKVDKRLPLWEPPDDDFWFNQRTAVFAKLPLDKTKKFVNSEDDVTTLVDLLITDVATKLGLEAEISFSRNVPHFDVKDDILVTKAPNKLKIGSIEVKKPGTLTDDALIFGTDQNPTTQVGGEVFHQLHLTRLNGPRKSYGLLTTWNKWQLVSSAPFDHDAIRKMQLPGLAKPKVNSKKSSPPPKMAPGSPMDEENHEHKKKLPPLQIQQGNPRVQQMTTYQEVSREFHGSKVYDFRDGKLIGRLVATALLSMYNSAFDRAHNVFNAPLTGPVRSVNFSREQNKKQNKKRNKNKWFSFSDCHIEQGLQLDTVPAKHCTRFFLWAPLGHGDSGACCLASTENGKAACVIKFFKRGLDTEEKAKQEGAYWQKIYAATYGWNFCCFRDLDGVSCLLMPYLREVSPKERAGLLKSGSKSLLWKALSFFARKGYRHDDLKWSHVGTFLRGPKKVKTVALFDLGRVSILNPKDRESWVTEAYDALVERAGCEDDEEMSTHTNEKG